MAKAPLLQTSGLTARVGKRVLFQDLNLCLDFDRVAMIGRNGVGKSTLLGILTGELRPFAGRVVRRGCLAVVPQRLEEQAKSPGQQRREALESALASEAQFLLLDEPSQDLDQENVDWLRGALKGWPRGLLVVTHDQRLLKDFRHFFLVAESGCRYFSGHYEQMVHRLECDFQTAEAKYLRRLSDLANQEERALQIARRRRRKKQYGRTSELDRATSRARLNKKRDAAQVYHGRINRLREQRLGQVREWTRAGRRALRVALPLHMQLPELPPVSEQPLIQATEVTLRCKTVLLENFSLSMWRQRLAVVGPNGSGKSTLLQTLMGELAPYDGQVRVAGKGIGSVAQGASNWMREESLAQFMSHKVGSDQAIAMIAAHKFPLALARRSMRSLSPGERARAALIAILSTVEDLELLVLDEPTYSLDILGQRALAELLRSWRGGLIVASHNRDFLDGVGMDRVIELGRV